MLALLGLVMLVAWGVLCWFVVEKIVPPVYSWAVEYVTTVNPRKDK